MEGGDAAGLERAGGAGSGGDGHGQGRQRPTNWIEGDAAATLECAGGVNCS